MDCANRLISIPITKISKGPFCFRDDLTDIALQASIKQLGLLQPLVVVKQGSVFQLVSGHKRLVALKNLKIKKTEAFLLSERNPTKIFISALLLNHSASYSDLDRCLVIQKAQEIFSGGREEIRKVVLPLIGLSPSLKVFEQYSQVGNLPETYLTKIRNHELPFVGSATLARFSPKDLPDLLKLVFSKIMPTASQLTHIGDWILDIHLSQKKSIAQLVAQVWKEIPSPSKDSRVLTNQFYQALRTFRFPDMAKKEKAFSEAAQALQGRVQGLQIKAPDHFEQEGFLIQAHVLDSKRLNEILQQLQHVQNQAATLFDTLL